MIVHLTQEFIDRKLICPDDRIKVEFVNDDRSGLYVLTTKGKQTSKFYWRYKNKENKTCHHPLGNTDTHSLSEIKEKLVRVRAEVLEGIKNEIDKPAIPSLKDYFYGTYLPYCKIKNRSWISKERLFKLRIEKEFGDKLLTDISYLELRNYHASLKESGYAGSTCDHPIRLLSHIFNTFNKEQENITFINQAARVQLFNEYNEVHNVLSEDDLKRLLAVLESSDTGPAKIAMLLIATGCRLNEILSASWECVDLEKCVLRVPSRFSKNKADRFVPLNDAAMDILNKLPTRVNASGPLVINPRTKKGYVCIFPAWKKLREKAGLNHIRIHDLRHAFGNRLADQNVSILTISRLLGHKNVVTSERYSVVSNKALRSASEHVSNAITSALHETSEES